MPVYDKKSLQRQAILGAHWILRNFSCAPDQLRARRIGRRLKSILRSDERADAKKVIFLTPRSWAVHVHWEATVAVALRLRGAKVDFITCGGGLERCDRTTTHEAPPMPCKSCTKYTNETLELYGMNTHPLEFAEKVTWPELDELDLKRLRQVEYRGVSVGRLVDVPVKWFLLNTQLEADPLGLLTYRAFIRSAKAVVDQLYDVLTTKKPDVLVVVNGLFLFESIAWELANQLGIDVVNYERGYIIDTLLFDRTEPACFGFLDSAWDTYANVELNSDELDELNAYLGDRQLGRRSIEEYWQQVDNSATFKNGSRRLTTLFTNLTWDSAVIGKEIAFESIHDWISSSIKYFFEHPEHDLIIRVHPAEVRLSGKPTREPVDRLIAERFPQLPPNIRIISATDTASSYVLMAESDVITVMTSTTGLEAALNGKPVIVSGNTAYRGKGFTHDVHDEVEYWAKLDDLLREPKLGSPERKLVERYAHLFFFKLPIQFDFVTEHLRGIARINYSRPDDLAPGRSVALDRICDGILYGGRFKP